MQLRLLTLYHTVVFPAAALSLVLALGFLQFTGQIETDELRFRLNNLSVRSDAVDPSDILLRLEQEKKFNATALKKSVISEDELKLLAAFSERRHTLADWLGAPSPARRFFKSLIGLMQRAAGITPSDHVYLADEIDLMTLAYNLERRRLFSEALVTFQKGLHPGITGEARDFILLHSGYCLFFLSEHEAARKTWREVAASASVAHNQKLAQRLLDWLEHFFARRGSAVRIADKKNRAREFYRIMAYKESLETLMQVGERQRDGEYFYLRGRVHEAPGEYTLAVSDYRETIARDPSGELATLANRRLYLMGASYRRNDRLAETAKGAGVGFKDRLFFGLAGEYVGNPPDAATLKEIPDYVPAEAYDELMKTAEKKLTQGTETERKKILTVRIKTHNGSVITGRQVSATASLVIIQNENGRFQIPTDDIESKEIVSGK